MKAIVFSKYGAPDVLRLKEVQKPQPKDCEVLVRIHAASLNVADAHVVSGEPFMMRLMCGLFKPGFSIPGSDMAGQVETVGQGVTLFRPGDEVYGDLSGCGWGAFAEYVAVPETELAAKPANLTFEQAAAVPMAAVTALQALCDKGGMRPGLKVLVNGASGGVGTFALQIAKALGGEVTAVGSPSKLDLLRSLGADHVIDYTREDFTQGEPRYDLILAANGYHPLAHYRRALSPGGVYVVAGGSLRQVFEAMLLGPLTSRGGEKKMDYLASRPSVRHLLSMKELIESGKVTPVIDRRYALPELPEALRYLEEGHVRGKVVIRMEDS